MANAVVTSNGEILTYEGRPVTFELQQAIEAAGPPPAGRTLTVDAPVLTLEVPSPTLTLEA